MRGWRSPLTFMFVEGSGAALDHVDDELVVKVPGGDLVTGLRSRVALLVAEHPSSTLAMPQPS
jgi:hypothetical protein